MKLRLKYILMLLVLLNANMLYAKGSVVSEYRKGQVIVKFRNSSDVTFLKGKRTLSSTNERLETELRKLNVKVVEPLMPLTGALPADAPRNVRAYDGKEYALKDMSTLYVLDYDSENQDVMDVIRQLESMSEVVEYAEPNYILSIQGQEDDEAEASMNEPLYSNQWGIQAINLPQLWRQPRISSHRPVIAIVDTGVDVEHPDLAANIYSEGWDFINDCKPQRDNNGHGTHCAGIAAAVGNNGLGITGANPNAWIMPVTVMQSNGKGDLATIIKGIDYAASHGADIISMSIGGYAYSKAEEDAVIRASVNAILVAAAGNDGKALSMKNGGTPSFPAAFPCVIAVEASDKYGSKASFSNYDDDGRYYSDYKESELYNYEVRAPGVEILSTYPGGIYKNLQGTSMACPLVAGAVSALIERKEYENHDYLVRDLIESNPNGVIDVMKAFELDETTLHPDLQVVGCRIDDSEGDGDGRIDAGEVIRVYPIVRAQRAKATDISLQLSLPRSMGQDYVSLVDETADFGYTLAPFAKGESQIPLRFKVADDCPDNIEIAFSCTASCPNVANVGVSDIYKYDVENGIDIGGLLSEDLTLQPDVNYILTSNLVVPEGITLTLLPGTVLKMKYNCGIACSGTLNAVGTKNRQILITRADINDERYSSGVITYSHGQIENVTFYNLKTGGALLQYKPNGANSKNDIIKHCTFNSISLCIKNIHAMYCTFSECSGLIYDSFISYLGDAEMNFDDPEHFGGIEHCNYTNSKALQPIFIKKSNCFGNYLQKFKQGHYYDEYYLMNLVDYSVNTGVLHLDNMYLGTANRELAKSTIYDIDHVDMDFMDIDRFRMVDITDLLTTPDTEAPAIVWKVLIDGVNPYDDAEEMDFVGKGRHKVEVYYSKPVSPDFIPSVSMRLTDSEEVSYGMEKPFDINEDGEWNEDHSIYTVYFTLDGTVDKDGDNVICVSGGRDLDGMEIPDEYRRFRFVVQGTAEALETTLNAVAGAHNVKLEWETNENGRGDLQGYIVYRYVSDEENAEQLTMPVLDASTTAYYDCDVMPGVSYHYYVAEIRSDLTEGYVSNVVSATPMEAPVGDANGSARVDIADVVTEVAYIMGDDPSPFVFEAADVNEDQDVNVLDVIGTVNVIMQPNGVSAVENDTVNYTIEDGILYIDSPIDLGGVQIEFIADAADSDFEILEGLEGLEVATTWKDDCHFLVLAYSMTGRSVPAGRHAVLRIGNATVEEIALSDVMGHNVIAVESYSDEGATSVNTLCETQNKDIVHDIAGRVLRQVKTAGVYIKNNRKTFKQ